MLGLMVFGALFIYLIVSIMAVSAAMNWAAKNGKPQGKPAAIAAVFMYSLVFWDLIPVHAVHSYQCNTNADFTVNKTLAQWKQENPDEAETLVAVKNSSSTQQGNTTRYLLNQRFAWEITREKVWHVVYKTDERIVDLKTNEKLAEYVDYKTNIGAMALRVRGLNDLKFWLKVKSCERSMWPKKQIKFNDFYTTIKKLGMSE